MKYRTINDRQRIVAPPGNPIVKTYVLNEDGRLVENGVTNIYDEIQSHRESVELSTLLQRYMAGDETALNQRQGIFIDTTEMPKTYAEMVDNASQAIDTFNKLPFEIRSVFNNNPAEFWSSFGSPEFLEKVNRADSKAAQVGNSNGSDGSDGAAGNNGNSNVGGEQNE